MNASKVIDLAAYKEAVRQRIDENEILELEDTANLLCEEAWHLLVPMRQLRIEELTIDSNGCILNINYQDDDYDEPNQH